MWRRSSHWRSRLTGTTIETILLPVSHKAEAGNNNNNNNSDNKKSYLALASLPHSTFDYTHLSLMSLNYPFQKYITVFPKRMFRVYFLYLNNYYAKMFVTLSVHLLF